MLHIYLFTQFWERYGRGFTFKEIIPTLPNGLALWFIRMFRYAGDAEAARRVVDNILAADGPFSDRHFLLSGMGSKLIEELAEASPRGTLECMERTIGQWDIDTLERFRGEQDMIWALEKIAVWPGLFCRAARMLLILAEAENNIQSGRASNTFAELFSLAAGPAAPTEERPEQRLPVLEEALNSHLLFRRQLGIKACGTALCNYGGGRLVGREHQGLRPTAKMWTPQTWEDYFDAYRAVWKLLANVSRDWDVLSRSEANNVLIDAAGGLLHMKPLEKMLFETLDQLAEDDATDLKRLVDKLAWMRRAYHDKLSELAASRIEKLDRHITGSNFASHVRRVIHLSGWNDLVDDDGKHDDAHEKRVSELASQALSDAALLRGVLPDLVCGTNNMVYHFGRKIGQVDEECQYLRTIVDAYRALKDTATQSFLGGYLSSLFAANREKWETVIRELICDDDFMRLASPLAVSSGYTDQAVAEIILQHDKGRLDVESLLSFRYSFQLRELQTDTVQTILDRLFTANETSACLDVLAYVYCDKGMPRPLPRQFTLRLLSEDCADSQPRDHDFGYHWGVVAAQFISQYPEQRDALFNAAMDKICSRGYWYPDEYPVNDVVRDLIKADPGGCWAIVASRLETKGRSEARNLVRWLGSDRSAGSKNLPGPLALFSCEDVLDWVSVAPEVRAVLISQAVPKTLASGNEGKLARELLNRYGDIERVCESLAANFLLGGYWGSGVDHYGGMRDEARQWLEVENSMRVRKWIEDYIEQLNRWIKREEIEEERRF
jgi:predicted DNA-binding ribbon-helix-helix protein